jgi:group I intron endonuclease
MQGIYCIEHVTSLRRYYGSSINIEKRIASHKRDLRLGRHHNIQLQRAVAKYGIESFDFKVVEETVYLSRKELLDYEQTFIDANKTGYNMAPANGGDCISKHPDHELIVAKIRDANNKRYAALSESERKEKYGRPGSTNPNYRNGGVSFKICPICNCNRISSQSSCCGKCRDRSGSHNPFYNKQHSEETKEILRKANSGENSWIKGILPSMLPYTNFYRITYANGTTKDVAGLKIIAQEFNVTIENIYATIKRISNGSPIPSRGKLAGVKLEKLCTE